MELKINFLAIIVAVIANFILGSIWYMPLFGKIWGKEMGYDSDVKPDKNPMYKGMLYMVLGNFLFAWVFAHNLGAWQFVPGMDQMGTFSIALSSAFFTWLGFYFPGHLSATVWERKSWKLFAINGGYDLVSLLVVALILSYWN